MNSVFGAFLNTLFSNFDMSMFRLFHSFQSDSLNSICNIVSSICSTKFIVCVMIFAIILALFKKTRKLGLYIVLALGITVLVAYFLLKPFCARMRPYNMLQATDYYQWYWAAGGLHESVYSFPSTHTAASFALATALFVWIRIEKGKRYAWLFPLIAILVACSRVYLMVHYCTDVIGGAIIGILCGLLAYVIGDTICETLNCWPGFLKNLDRIDLEVVVKKITGRQISKKVAVVLITLGFCACLGISVMGQFKGNEGCQFKNDEFSCQNEAEKTQVYNDKTHQWENRCKLHEQQNN